MAKEVEQSAGESLDLDVETGAQALLGLLSDDLEIQAVGAGESDGSDADDADGSDVGDDLEDADDADDEDRDEDADDDVDDEADEETDDSDDDPPTYKVKVDGEEIEVTLEEALAGYQRQSAFTKRTQQLAEERKALREQEAEVAQTRQEYLNRLNVVKAVLEGTANEPNWEQLKKDDPARYAELRLAWQERKDQIASVEAEIERARAEQQAAFERMREEVLAAEAEKLEAAIPEWAADPDTAASEKQKIANFAIQTYGFTNDDLGNVVDHRLVLLLRDAMRFHDLQTKGKKAKEEVRGKRRQSPTLKPGTQARKSRKSSKRNPARARLAKTGRVDDAAATLLDFVDL